MATKDGLAQIWYADANGVITGNTPNADNVASAIIDGYNEHYGTDIGIWTPETISLQVGGTVPNWPAYEKIIIPPMVKFKYYLPNGTYCAGYTQGEKAYVNVNAEQTMFNMDIDGKIRSVYGTPENVLVLLQQPLYRQFGVLYAEILGFEPGWSIGETVEDWNSYILIE